MGTISSVSPRPEIDSSHAPLLELDNVCKSYREGATRRTVLRGLNARIERGEFVCVIGRSGTGKSTLLNLLGGIDLPESGGVRFEGRDLVACSERERTLLRRRCIGFVFQFFNLVPTLNVEENLLLPLELNGVEPAVAKARVTDLIERVSLLERAASFPETLSGGEQQRVAILRALAHEPRLVLADEPTGNLDAETGREVLGLLRSLTKGANASLVMATHSTQAARLADRVLRIEDGRLVDHSSIEAASGAAQT